MKYKKLSIAYVLAVAATYAAAQTPVGTNFSYQARLLDSGMDHEQIGTFFTMRWFVLAGFQCCGWVFILLALFRRPDAIPVPQHQAAA